MHTKNALCINELDGSRQDLIQELLAKNHSLQQQIKEHEQVEAQLRATATRLRVALESSRVGTWTWDMVNNTVLWDDYLQRLFGYEPGTFPATYEAFLNSIHPDDRERVRNDGMQLINSLDHFDNEFKIIWPDNSIHVIASRGVVYRDLMHGTAHMTGVCWDMSEYKYAEEALRESEEKFRSIVETTNEWIWAIDLNFQHTYSNPSVYTILGYTPEEMIGKSTASLVHEEEWPRISRMLMQCVAENTGWSNLIVCMKHKDGSERYLESTAVPKLNCDGKLIGFRGADRDITERKRTEEWARQHQQELTHVSRINFMGEMASALAHELNQPLAAIVNYTSGCVRRLETSFSEQTQMLHAMRQVIMQAERAGEIIHRMKDFVRKGKLYYEVVNINDVIHEIITLTNYEITQMATALKLNLANDLLPVRIDRIQIQQVVLNLLRNAIDAMQENKIVNPEIILRSEKLTADTIEISVLDNGPGIASDLENKLFEPYFTTKPHGMGMGLAICRTIIEAHGGHLAVRPNPVGGGTWFYFTLPVVK